MTSCLLNENHDFLRLAINTVRNDIIGRNETFQCLALTLVRCTIIFSPRTLRIVVVNILFGMITLEFCLKAVFFMFPFVVSLLASAYGI